MKFVRVLQIGAGLSALASGAVLARPPDAQCRVSAIDVPRRAASLSAGANVAPVSVERIVAQLPHASWASLGKRTATVVDIDTYVCPEGVKEANPNVF